MNDGDRPRYMIRVAAELVGNAPADAAHLRAEGARDPQRTPGNTRLYSDADVERLRLIQRLTTELGLNLAGVEHVLRLEDELRRLRLRMERLEQEIATSRRGPPLLPARSRALPAATGTRGSTREEDD